eukprot:UN07741
MKNEMPLFLLPTYGFTNHIIPIKFKNYEISLFDLGGSITIRGYWDNYYSEAHCVIFVIDSSDADRFEQVRKQFTLLTKARNLQNKPILIICNKCDSPTFVSSKIVSRKINVESIKAPYKIIETSATLKTKSILDQGLMFLLLTVHQNYEIINKKIQLNHKEVSKIENKRITLQRQRVQEWKDDISSSDSSIISPGKMRKYKHTKDEYNEIENDKISKIAIVRANDIDRPSSAPLNMLESM